MGVSGTSEVGGLMAAEPRPEGAVDLGALVPVIAEDAAFALAAGAGDLDDVLAGLSKRRADAYAAIARGAPAFRLSDSFESWAASLARAMAPVAPPAWWPMMQIVREKITLELGARGLRSLFSTKPSDKEVERVRRLGGLAARALRSTLAADGPLDGEEAMFLAGFLGALGLPDADASSLFAEPPMNPQDFDVPIDIEPNVGHSILRGAWFAAALDHIDPREETIVRAIAARLHIGTEELEAGRKSALVRVDARRDFGFAVIDGLRHVLCDRVPGIGATLPAALVRLVLPRRYREEALAPIGHGSPVTFGKRYEGLPSDDKRAAASLVWALALAEDPGLGRRAILYARFARAAEDLGLDPRGPSGLVEAWIQATLIHVAREAQ